MEQVTKFLLWFGTFNAVDVLAVTIFALFWVWIWRINRAKDDTYDLTDNIKDPYTNKAAGSALVYLTLAGVSVWWIVRFAVGGGDPSNFILAVLGVFIVKGGFDRAVSAWGNRPPDKAPEPESDETAPAQQQVAEVSTETTVTVKGKKGKA